MTRIRSVVGALVCISLVLATGLALAQWYPPQGQQPQQPQQPGYPQQPSYPSQPSYPLNRRTRLSHRILRRRPATPSALAARVALRRRRCQVARRTPTHSAASG